MCSFLVTSIMEFIIEYVNFYLKFRGPDFTKDVIINKIRFIHNLLHMTGEVTLQPFVSQSGNIVCLFNGEIYNYKQFGDYKSDGCCLIDVYQKYGTKFVKELDGEFAIVLFDFSKNIFICSTDVFATKPIWLAIENRQFGISSYESALKRLEFTNSVKIPANTTLVYNLRTLKLVETFTVFDFNLEQKSDSYDGWITAFDNAIKKRAQNTTYDVFVCLSSGYDSGTICCALNKLAIPYFTYTIEANENIDVMNKRFEINKTTCKENIYYKLTEKDFFRQRTYLKKSCENFVYYIPNQKVTVMSEDKGAVGISYIFKQASSSKRRVYLSGQGVDEIYSDYGFAGHKYYKHSQFGGLFPSDLTAIFPWVSFYDGTQKSYLGKEENVSGGWGIEGRYPFLDKYVVQEFLWLKAELKNKYYKAPLHMYMQNESYPFDEGVKIGFKADTNLVV